MSDNKTTGQKMFFTVCFPEKLDWVIGKLKKANAHSIAVQFASGIRKTSLANMLGFIDNGRRLVTAVIDEKDVESLFDVLYNEYYHGHDTGIAFTINIDAHAGAKSMMLIDAFLKSSPGESEKKHGNNKKSKDKEQGVTE